MLCVSSAHALAQPHYLILICSCSSLIFCLLTNWMRSCVASLWTKKNRSVCGVSVLRRWKKTNDCSKEKQTKQNAKRSHVIWIARMAVRYSRSTTWVMWLNQSNCAAVTNWEFFVWSPVIMCRFLANRFWMHTQHRRGNQFVCWHGAAGRSQTQAHSEYSAVRSLSLPNTLSHKHTHIHSTWMYVCGSRHTLYNVYDMLQPILLATRIEPAFCHSTNTHIHRPQHINAYTESYQLGNARDYSIFLFFLVSNVRCVHMQGAHDHTHILAICFYVILTEARLMWRPQNCAYHFIYIYERTNFGDKVYCYEYWRWPCNGVRLDASFQKNYYYSIFVSI